MHSRTLSTRSRTIREKHHQYYCTNACLRLHACTASTPTPTKPNKVNPGSNPLNSTTGGRNHESDIIPTTLSPLRPVEILFSKTGDYFLQSRRIYREFHTREEIGKQHQRLLLRLRRTVLHHRQPPVVSEWHSGSAVGP
ncbi:hypothetical protein KSP39_PZI008357 [Platanthera zijinensis]|uniref:Uncharacterized protein n=1 Tax=Platanthera zijinensis TaxID=2320716 RepID=A0AAP0BQS9_9ASPA